MILKKICLIFILSSILAYSNAQAPKKMPIDEFISKLENLESSTSTVNLSGIEVNPNTEQVFDIASRSQEGTLNLNFNNSILNGLRFIDFTNIYQGIFKNGTFTNITFINTQTSLRANSLAGLIFNAATVRDMRIDGGSKISFVFSSGQFNGIVVSRNSQLLVAHELYGIQQEANFEIEVHGSIIDSDFSGTELDFRGDAADPSFNMDDTFFYGSKGKFQIIGNGNQIQGLTLNHSTFSTIIWENFIARSWNLNNIIWGVIRFSNMTGNNISAINSIVLSGSVDRTFLTFLPDAEIHLHINMSKSSFNYTGNNNKIFVSGSTIQRSQFITGSGGEGSSSGVLNMDHVTITQTTGELDDEVGILPVALRETVLTNMIIEENATLDVGDNAHRPTVDIMDLTGTEIQHGGRIILRNMVIRTLDLTRLTGTGTLLLHNVRIQDVIGHDLGTGDDTTIGGVTIRLRGGTRIGGLQLNADPRAINARPTVDVDATAHINTANFGSSTNSSPQLRSSANGIQTNIDCNTANYVLYSNGTWCYKRNN